MPAQRSVLNELETKLPEAVRDSVIHQISNQHGKQLEYRVVKLKLEMFACTT